MKKLYSLFMQDFSIALRNSMMWLVIIMIVLMAVTVKFLIPDNLEDDEVIYFYDKSENAMLKTIIENITGTPGNNGNNEDNKDDNNGYNKETNENEGSIFLNSEEELEKAVKENRNSIGIIFEGNIQNPHFTVITQTPLKEENANVVKASLENMIAGISGLDRAQNYKLEFIREQSEPVSLKLFSVPGILVFEVLILGFMLVAVFIYQEKSEGSIKAYRISPGGTSLYILSKTLVFVVLGLIYGTFFVITTIGFPANYLKFAAVVILGTALYTFLGFIVAVFYNSLSKWLFPGVLVLVLNMLPILSSLMPAFAPEYIKWILSYPVISGMNEILFPTGKPLGSFFAYLVILNIAFYMVCHILVHKKLMKEGR
ncbi:MAG: ABC transporter permease [Firmicutes bacterium]|nr:ABC transporter permease [Bacillota bacterium]